MKKVILIGFLCLYIYSPIFSQNLFGIVTNDKDEALFGATVQWEGADVGVVADENGHFELPQLDITANLLINYVGYNAMLIEVEGGSDTVLVVLEGLYDLMEIEVAAKLMDNYVSTLDPINIETISSGELRKAACCNLAESFTTNGSIDVGISDAVTGARHIQMLGLRGTYTQLMIENRPALGGLSSAYALEYIPGTWLSSIQISKGTSTVINGYQSITGQINSELVKPFEDSRVFVNLYGSTFGRGELNVHLNKKINDKWSAGTLLHASTMQNNLDGNDDNFYDTPQKTLYDGIFRLFYQSDLLTGQFNIHALRDRHTAGQIASQLPAGSPVYRIQQDHDRVEAFGKLGYLGFKNPNTSLGLITNVSWHNLDSYYGNRRHHGVQKNAYANLIFTTALKNTDHKLSFGGSYLYDDYDELLDDTDFSRTESVPGAFIEYSFSQKTENHLKKEGETKKSFLEGFGLVLGMRIDRHNLFGTIFTPRLNLKYNFSENSIVRLSGGRGYRTANAVAENVGLLASSKQFSREEDLRMEDAWNFGANFTQKYTLGDKAGHLSIDAFRTDFNNQVVLDRQHVRDKILIFNLDGKSFSNSLLVMVSQEIIQGLEVKFAYKYNDVKLDTRHGFHRRILLPPHRGLVTIGYETPNEKWSFHGNLQLTGWTEFPENWQFPDELIQDHDGFSPAYQNLGGQITRRFERWEFYIGGENLLNFRQPNPIIDAENPFGEFFNATQVYAPITGAMGYFGLRFDIPNE